MYKAVEFYDLNAFPEFLKNDGAIWGPSWSSKWYPNKICLTVECEQIGSLGEGRLVYRTRKGLLFAMMQEGGYKEMWLEEVAETGTAETENKEYTLKSTVLPKQSGV